MKVLIVGSVAYDTVETAAGRVEYALGGAATYASVAAGFYAEPCLVGVVGEDFEKKHEEFLLSRGVDLSGLQHKPGKTFHWAGRYLPDMIGRETLDTQLNVFETFDPVLPGPLDSLEYVFLANIHPSLQKRVLDQARNPRLIVLDTMDLWINTAKAELEELFPRVDVLVINDEEARMLTGEYNILRGGEMLLQRVKKAVIVKRGEHGSTLLTKEGMFVAPAYPVKDLVDPTGAGDSFAGALIGWLARNGDLTLSGLKSALVRGAALASFTVEGFSMDRLRKISAENVEQRVRELKALVAFE